MAFDRQAAYQQYQQAFNARAQQIIGGGTVSPMYQQILAQYDSPDAYVNALEAQYNQNVLATPTTPPSGSSTGSTGGASSAGYAGGSGGTGTSTTSSNAGFSGLTTSGSNTGTVTTPNPPTTNPPTAAQTGTPAVGSTQSGFSGLTGTGSGAGVGTTANTQTTNTVANTQKLGSNAYSTLLSTYQTLYPGAEISSTDGQQMFNQWVDGIRQQTGAATMEDIPTTFSQGMPANYTQGGPGGPGTATVPAGSNYQQNQNANQSGSFNTTGTTNTTQNQTTGSTANTVGQQTTQGTQQGTTTTQGTQQQTGGQTTTTGQQTSNTGTSTTAPTDLLGFGSLLKGQAAGAASSDAERNAFLQDVMKTGGTGFNSQVDQAVRNSLTGPRMTGAGDSAQARAAGYAASDIARNNLTQRLGAASELTHPGSLATIAAAAQPYGVGSSTTNTGTSNQTGTSTGTNFSNLVTNENVNSLMNTLQKQNNESTTNQAGFSNLTGSQNESQSGTASGSSKQSAAGVIPQAQTVSTGGGGCVLCTAATELGLFNDLRVLRRVIDHKLNKDRSTFGSAARGYFAIFTPVARWFLTRPRLARIFYPMARAVVYEELRVSGRRLPRRTWASFIHWTGHYTCHLVGKLPVSGRVQDPVIESIARKHNIWFTL